MSQVMVIYHGGCTDGWCGAWILDRCFNGVELHPVRHGDPPPVVDGRTVIMVDFSFSRKDMEEMKEFAHSMTVLDHHETAKKDCEDLDFCIFDMNKSGATLAYEWCERRGLIDNLAGSGQKNKRDVATGMKVMARYVEDYDLMRLKMPSTRPVNACIRSYQFDLRQWDMLAKRCAVTPESLVQEGEAVLRYRKDLIDQHKNRIVIRNIDSKLGDFDVPIVECTCREIVSDLLNDVCKGYPFAMSFYMQEEDVVFSLRSEEGAVNVAELAEEFGGGGHPNSAGFTVPNGVIM